MVIRQVRAARRPAWLDPLRSWTGRAGQNPLIALSGPSLWNHVPKPRPAAYPEPTGAQWAARAV
ncbi:hypothetical protein PCASD_14151, partial [Puccinia coronata f. sp. avenae]